MSEWHPIFLSDEPTPGVWTLQHSTGYGPFARIELRRVEVGLRYRVEFRGELLGWATSLQVACERAWEAYLKEGRDARSGPPNGRL
ncbi:hypothetical protein [Microbacterium sp. XT11]|uniref:hypothetical protein n=1 Tax=Microbacterium sp. XT11 TaxID=367477 RepID=UPI00082F4C57|nr:hypothetical protein [Microbacterium sp. XT11]